MISDQDVARYQRDGYLVVPDVLSAPEVAALQRVTDEFVKASRAVSEHTDVFDLEPGHSAAQPRLRRIKTPHLHHPLYAQLVRHPRIVAVLQRLWGPNVRFDMSKLNHKAAGFGRHVPTKSRVRGQPLIGQPSRYGRFRKAFASGALVTRPVFPS